MIKKIFASGSWKQPVTGPDPRCSDEQDDRGTVIRVGVECPTAPQRKAGANPFVVGTSAGRWLGELTNFLGRSAVRSRHIPGTHARSTGPAAPDLTGGAPATAQQVKAPKTESPFSADLGYGQRFHRAWTYCRSLRPRKIKRPWPLFISHKSIEIRWNK